MTKTQNNKLSIDKTDKELWELINTPPTKTQETSTAMCSIPTSTEIQESIQKDGLGFVYKKS